MLPASSSGTGPGGSSRTGSGADRGDGLRAAPGSTRPRAAPRRPSTAAPRTRRRRGDRARPGRGRPTSRRCWDRPRPACPDAAAVDQLGDVGGSTQLTPTATTSVDVGGHGERLVDGLAGPGAAAAAASATARPGARARRLAPAAPRPRPGTGRSRAPARRRRVRPAPRAGAGASPQLGDVEPVVAAVLRPVGQRGAVRPDRGGHPAAPAAASRRPRPPSGQLDAAPQQAGVRVAEAVRGEAGKGHLVRRRRRHLGAGGEELTVRRDDRVRPVGSRRADHSSEDRSCPRASSAVASPPSRTTTPSARARAREGERVDLTGPSSPSPRVAHQAPLAGWAPTGQGRETHPSTRGTP